MKKALIVANLAGFASFLMNDFDILSSMGYELFFASNTNVLPWDDTKRELENQKIHILQVDFDSKKPISALNMKAFCQLVKIIKTEKFDIIHCHTPIAGMLTRMAALFCREKNRKIIYTTHGLSYTQKSSWKMKAIYRLVEDTCSYVTDAIITINHEDYGEVRKMHCKNVFYLPGVGVDVKKYNDVVIDRSQYRKSIGVNDDEIMVLSVGELSTRKNHRIIIDALSLINSKNKYVYVVCGNGINGGTGSELRELARRKQVRLLLLGFRNDIPEIMKCSDIGAMPSLREGLGLSGIQSLAAGVPLVGSAVQGIKDYVIDGQTGYLCSPNDVEDFAKKIQLLTKTVIEKVEWESSCFDIAQKFDTSISKQEMKKIYVSILC